jgi:hypothetical protein
LVICDLEVTQAVSFDNPIIVPDVRTFLELYEVDYKKSGIFRLRARVQTDPSNLPPADTQADGVPNLHLSRLQRPVLSNSISGTCLPLNSFESEVVCGSAMEGF